MNELDAQIGVRIRSLRDFSGVPAGTEGIIDELYGDETGQLEGCTVAWDMPDKPLPADYREYDGRPAIQSGILRDGFSWDDLQHLDAIRGPLPTGYWHKEAFCLMDYKCKECGTLEQLWNSRDGVTPFSIRCRDAHCNGKDTLGSPMSHVDFHKDKCYPAFVPHPGLRIFINMPESVAHAYTRLRWNAYLANAEDAGFPLGDEENTKSAIFEDIYRDGKASWVVTL